MSLKPTAGWTAATTSTKLATPIKNDDGGEITSAITKITWTASAGAEIKPGYFQEFDVSLGPLPTADQIVFKALQTYSDGSIVRWIDEPTTDGSEPDHPAPVLKLTAAAAATDSVADAPVAGAAPAVKAGDAGLAWGIAALVVAVLALIMGVLAFRRAGSAAKSA